MYHLRVRRMHKQDSWNRRMRKSDYKRPTLPGNAGYASVRGSFVLCIRLFNADDALTPVEGSSLHESCCIILKTA